MAVLDDDKIVLPEVKTPELSPATNFFDEEQFTEAEGRLYTDPNVSPVAEETLFSWVAPSRVPREKPSRKYYFNLGLIILLIALILIFANQFSLLMVVLALAFLAYVLVHTKPQRVRHTITNFGIRTDNKYFAWSERGEFFWFEKNHDYKLLVVETKKFPYRITMLVGNEANVEILKEVLQLYLVNKKPEPTKIDKFIEWCKRKFPLE